MRTRKPPAFTLIEILIVVAIIAILAAIAIPNMLEAQIRAKVSRVKADHRTLIGAMEMYRLDFGNMPPSISAATVNELYPLTTPVAYISSVPHDPFIARSREFQHFPQNVYDLCRYRQTLEPIPILHTGDGLDVSANAHYCFVSVGPDNTQEIPYVWLNIEGFLFTTNTYDPTNGSNSKGDIYSFGSGSQWK